MIRSITYRVGGNSARLELSTGLVLVVAGPHRHEVFASLDAACEALGDDPREINVERFDVEGRGDGLCTPRDERDVIVYELHRLGATVETDDGNTSRLVVNGVERRWYGTASAFNVFPLLA